MAKIPILSVSIIAKNEANWIDKIIQDCKGFADEVVVCDTGSTDDTVKIAKKLGAKIVHFEWCNNFSAARNASLKACNGSYVFWLDCDDRIPLSQQKRLKLFKDHFLVNNLKRNSPVAYQIKMLSSDNSTNSIMEQLRIFPKVSDEMWYGRVHEAVGWAVYNAGIPTKSTDIRVFHEGYVDKSVLNAKIKRNIELLYQDVKDTDDPVKLSYIGASLHNTGDTDGAMEVFEKIFENEDFRNQRSQYFIFLMRMHVSLAKQERFQEMFGAMELAKKYFPGEIQPWTVQAKISYSKGKILLARELAAEALKRDYDYNAGIPVIKQCREQMEELLRVSQNITLMEEKA